MHKNARKQLTRRTNMQLHSRIAKVITRKTLITTLLIKLKLVNNRGQVDEMSAVTMQSALYASFNIRLSIIRAYLVNPADHRVYYCKDYRFLSTKLGYAFWCRKPIHHPGWHGFLPINPLDLWPPWIANVIKKSEFWNLYSASESYYLYISKAFSAPLCKPYQHYHWYAATRFAFPGG